MKITNWKLSLLAFIVFCLFVRLGFWQLTRAHEKTNAISLQNARLSLPALSAGDLIKPLSDVQFHKLLLNGRFDNERTLLLDNKTYHGRVGYEVFTPFYVQDSDLILLIDRGFTPAYDRKSTPTIKTIDGITTIEGMLIAPPKYAAWGKMLDTNAEAWPLRIEYIDLRELETVLHVRLYPLVVILQPNGPAALDIEWKITNMPPEKHLAYAVQWFALASTLLILFVALQCRYKNKRSKES